MEHNVGVGAIIGLVLTSSIYVWNNEKFSSVQKTILLICIVFPPAQWLGILIVLAYNSNVENNTLERKTEKKLDTTILNLTELKQKGILTAEEYRTKVQKIENEKTEQSLKNSLEYKQLKSLFDSGVLTKEEFESKVQLLQSSAEKTVNKEETVFRETTNNQLLKIISQPNQTIGARVYINDLIAPDGVYNYKSGTHKIIVEKGKIKERYFTARIKNLIIEKTNIDSIQKGDNVFLDTGFPAPTGKYSLGFLSDILIIENGKFVKNE